MCISCCSSFCSYSRFMDGSVLVVVIRSLPADQIHPPIWIVWTHIVQCWIYMEYLIINIQSNWFIKERNPFKHIVKRNKQLLFGWLNLFLVVRKCSKKATTCGHRLTMCLVFTMSFLCYQRSLFRWIFYEISQMSCTPSLKNEMPCCTKQEQCSTNKAGESLSEIRASLTRSHP